MASIDYYDDESLYGNYQYVTLEEIVNTYIVSRTEDDYTSHIPRFQILLQAKRGLRELYYDVVKEIRAIELELSPNLSVVLPPDYVQYVRISYVDSNGKLNPMGVDRRINLADAYLQDDKFNLLFDSTGCVLMGSGVREPLHPAMATLNSEDYTHYQFCDTAFTPNSDLSNQFKNGKYRVDPSRGIIEFGSSANGKNIVLEYISDGLFTGCEGRPDTEIRIHKFAESALLDYIYSELIKRARNVPDYEKRRAEKEYNKNKRKARRRINAVRYDELIQVFKGDSKWIKGA